MTLAKSFTFDIPTEDISKINQLKSLLNDLNIKFNENEIIIDEIYSKIENKPINQNELLNIIPNNYGIKIVMNEDKIKRENKHTLENIYSQLDEFAEKSNMIKLNDFIYIPKDDDHTYCAVFNFAFLEKSQWFLDNVEEWLSINKPDNETTNMIELEKDELSN